MITEEQLDPIVNKLLDAFPTFDDWWSAKLTDAQRQGMRAAWRRQVEHLEPSDIAEAAESIARGRDEARMPKNYEFDRLGYELRTWGGVAAARRIEIENTQRRRVEAQPEADRTAQGVNRRFGQAIKCASSWGVALRAGLVTKTQNEDAMAVIHQFHKVGNVSLVWPEVSAKCQKTVVDFWRSPKAKRNRPMSEWEIEARPAQ